ncbi:hypothetical protein PENFLA_c001G10950 [Penicillium flavigenum]|uniref:Uncharacterized protein n=1 Tax=Penicillium flavigenum TaxID=254877 RepID=A0A1V6U2G8_9EURO|nr:hypothetical protein PENFLA_c091G03583 [Penicillium flavigenum]OQE32757.1 hypothetical protein PENFLA_c001G10950 [Penicillium flavigenum]
MSTIRYSNTYELTQYYRSVFSELSPVARQEMLKALERPTFSGSKEKQPAELKKQSVKLKKQSAKLQKPGETLDDYEKDQANAKMRTAQIRSPRYREQHPSGMESTGFVVLSASSDGADIKLEFAGKVKEAIGEVDFPIRQGPVIVLSLEDHSTWGTKLAHPSRNAVSVFRDLSDTDETRVTFMLYPPDLPKEEIRETRPFIRKLLRNEILFVKGSVRMELEVPAGGSFVWQGNSGEPMGPDMLGPEVFEFMAL